MTNMRLEKILPNGPVPNLMISGLSDDSRIIEPGEAFIATKGEVWDGHDFVEDAKRKGAAVILCERPISIDGLPVILVPELREKRGAIAASFYSNPSAELVVCGVTGTNGKTSISHYIAELGHHLGYVTGYLGTLGYGVRGKLKPSPLTTLDAISLQKSMRSLTDAGATMVAMEVSSHALNQDRVDHISFDTAIFSNLSHDHLDYHQSIEAYRTAKARLFKWETLSKSIINIDDEFGKSLATRISHGVECITFGENGEVTWSDLSYAPGRITGKWRTPWGKADLDLNLLGQFSVANMAAALAFLCSEGESLSDVASASTKVVGVPGRMELFKSPSKPTVIVDYAHTPDALENALVTARMQTDGRLVCLLGCGGDRDAKKRPIMGAIAERLADELWFTTDNARSEDPHTIVEDMCSGLKDIENVNKCLDRQNAIESAFHNMAEGDLLFVAGRGHETTQEIAGKLVALDDRALVSDLMEMER